MKILKHGYQRNGIGGEGFHYFEIEDEKERLIATMTVDCGETEDPKAFNGSCRVVSPDNLDKHWRGDVFEEFLRKNTSVWWRWDKPNDDVCWSETLGKWVTIPK